MAMSVVYSNAFGGVFAENRLSTYLAPGSSVSYTYSGDMLKRAEWVSGTPTTLVWDGQNYLEGGS